MIWFCQQITESEECLQFGAEQVVPMGLVQPASAVIYDYYNPGHLTLWTNRFADNTSECWTLTNAIYSMCYTEKRCGIFYTAPHKSPMISKLCSGDVCTCAEGEKNSVYCDICFCLSVYYIHTYFQVVVQSWKSPSARIWNTRPGVAMHVTVLLLTTVRN